MDMDEAKKANDQKLREKTYGGYNDFPPNWKEIDEKEFVQGYFFTYAWTHTETRQMLHGGSMMNGYTGATLFFYHDGSGVAMSSDYWAGKIRYYKFAACLHECVTLSQEECRKQGIYHGGRCYTVTKCKKCGYVDAVDSSG